MVVVLLVSHDVLEACCVNLLVQVLQMFASLNCKNRMPNGNFALDADVLTGKYKQSS